MSPPCIWHSKASQHASSPSNHVSPETVEAIYFMVVGSTQVPSQFPEKAFVPPSCRRPRARLLRSTLARACDKPRSIRHLHYSCLEKLLAPSNSPTKKRFVLP